MKKLLILGVGKKTSSLVEELVKHLPTDIEVNLAKFEDVVVNIEQRNTSILVDGKNILNYDLVYFRRAGKKFIWLAGTISIFLEANGKKYFDSVYKNIGPIGTKLTALMKLAVSGLPVVPSVHCYSENLLNNSKDFIKSLGLPLVAKELYSQRGLGVSLIQNKNDFEKIISKFPGKRFMFQKFIDKKEEFRVLVLGEEIGCFERKIASDPNEFRNNVSLGAKEEFIEIKLMPKKIRDVSIKAAKSLGIEIAGVDIVTDKKGNVWVLEVNRGPGFTYDSKDSPEVLNLSRFFVKEITKKI